MNGVVKSAYELDIKKWKATHGEVFEIEVDKNDEGTEVAVGYFKKPDLNVLALAMKDANTDPIKSGKTMFSNCWLGGDEVMLTNDEVQLAAIGQLGLLFKVRAARIKNV